MPNALGSFLLQMGRQIEYGQQQQQFESEQRNREALAQLRMQEVSDAQAKQQEQKRLSALHKQLGGEIAAAQSADQSDLAGLQESAKRLSGLAMRLAAEDDFKGAKRVGDQAKERLTEAKTLQSTQAKERDDKNQAAAQAAYNVLQDPSPANVTDLMQTAKDAGVNPIELARMPPEKLSAFARTLVNKDKAMRTDLERVEREKADRARLEKFHADDERDKLLARSQTAAHQQRMERFEERRLGLEEKRIALAAEKSSGGGALSKPMQESIQKVNQAAPQLAQQFELLGEMAPGTTLAAFAQLKSGGDVSAALAKAGTTSLTSQEQQFMAATAKGAGITMGRLIQAAEGGNRLTQSQQDTLETALVPAAGETALTAAFKHARMSEEVTSMLSHLPLSRMPDDQRKQIEETAARFRVPVSSKRILQMAKASKNPAALAQVMETSATLEKAMAPLAEGGKGGAPAVPAAPALPAGWSVKAH